jgi:hypothetical protein
LLSLYICAFCCPLPGERERRTVAKVIERLDAHYEVQDVEMGKVYKWRPESVVVECECGKTLTLTAKKNACGGCGADQRAIVELVVLGARPENEEEEEEEVEHPWRSLRPYYSPTRRT